VRLKYIQNILSPIKFKEVGLGLKQVTSTTKLITNINQFKIFLTHIEQIELFDEDIMSLKKTELFGTGQDEITLGNNSAHEIFRISNYIVNASASLLKVFKKLLPPSEEFSIGLKLPEPSDFESLVKSMSVVQKALSQVLTNDIIKGHLKINNWEFGSYWIELILNTQAAVTLVAGIAWSACVISKKFKEGKILGQQIKSLEIKNESLQDILESQRKATSQLIEYESKGLLVKHFGSDEDNEYFERLKLAVRTFAELIQKGAEVHPVLNAPETIQNLFPNFKTLDSLTSQIKLLEEKQNNTDDV